MERISVEVADIMSRLNRMKNGSEVTVFVFHMIRLWQIWCVCACVCERLCPVYLSFPVSATVMLSAFPTPVETGVSLCAQGYHFSGISGHLDVSGNLAKVREKAQKSVKGQGICVVGEI